MDIHELKVLDFDEAVDLIESRLVDIRELIARHEVEIDDDDRQQLEQSRAEAAEQLENLRAAKTAEMAGERDNLLTEVIAMLDQLGKRVSDLFPNS